MIIGSYAIMHWFPDFPKEPQVLDIVGRGTVFEKTLAKSSNLELNIVDNPVLEGYNHYFCPQDYLYTMEVALYLWGQVPKEDALFLKGKGCLILRPLLRELFELFNDKYGEIN